MRWRKRHLEPGMVKGQRMGTKKVPQAQCHSGGVTVPSVEALALEVGELIAEFPGEIESGEQIRHLRGLLRLMPKGSNPRLPLRVWLHLVDYCLHEDATIRRNPYGDMLMDEFDFALLHGVDILRGEWLSIACDWHGHAVNGWPEGWDDQDA